jgi:hypothetical protein
MTNYMQIKTVGELINELQKYPLEMQVRVFDGDSCLAKEVMVSIEPGRYEKESVWPYSWVNIKEEFVELTY